jgi:hypothetical protein
MSIRSSFDSRPKFNVRGAFEFPRGSILSQSTESGTSTMSPATSNSLWTRDGSENVKLESAVHSAKQSDAIVSTEDGTLNDLSERQS